MKRRTSILYLWCESLVTIISRKKKLCFFSLGLLMVFSVIMSWLWGEINHDTVYYMNTVRLMTEGYTPYHDFNLGYTPLVFYLLYIPASIFGTQPAFALTCAYIALLFDAVLVYKICKKQTSSKSLAIFGMICFLMLSWHFESNSFYLEPFVLLSGLSSILILLYSKKKSWIILSGFLCFMSFWSKQYGLGFIFLTTIYTLIDHWFSRKAWMEVALLWVGFVCAAVFFVDLMFLQGVSPDELFGLSGSGYQRAGFSGLWLGFKAIIRWCCPLLIVITFFICNFRKASRDAFLVMSLLGIGGFVLQTYVRPYGHYLILMSPFCIFAVVYMLTIIADSRWLIPLKMLCVVMVGAYAHWLGVMDVGILEKWDERNKMEMMAKDMEQFIPRGSHNVYPYSDFDRLLAYHLETLPPVNNKKGLGLSFEGNEEQLLESIKSSDYVIANGLVSLKARFLLEPMFDKHIIRGINIYTRKSAKE